MQSLIPQLSSCAIPWRSRRLKRSQRWPTSFPRPRPVNYTHRITRPIVLRRTLVTQPHTSRAARFMAGPNFAEFVLAHLLQCGAIGLGIVLDGNLGRHTAHGMRSEEHTSELQSL